MAQNVFRITPRASQVIRAIEGQLQSEYNDLIQEAKAPPVLVVFNAGDFKFGEIDSGRVVVSVFELEMAYTLPDDPEFVLYHQQYEGVVILQQHRVKKPGEKDFVHYTTESVQLTMTVEAEKAA